MLAQILPGFRDFRTPLITGYLWLVFLWLLIGLPLPDATVSEGPMGVINAFGEFLSPAVYITVLSFTAYLIGMLLMQSETGLLYRSLQLASSGLSKSLGTSGQYLLRNRISLLVDGEIKKCWRKNVSPSALLKEFDLHGLYPDEETYEEHRSDTGDDPTLMKMQNRSIVEDRLNPLLENWILQSLPSLAVKLHEQNRDLFDRYDKERSEGEFRLSISLPLLVISIYSFINGSSFYGDYWPMFPIATFIGVCVLGYKAVAKFASAQGTLMTTLEIEAVSSSEITRLRNLQLEQDAKPTDF